MLMKPNLMLEFCPVIVQSEHPWHLEMSKLARESVANVMVLI